MASVGEILGGKYRLDRILGEGGMGAVFAAENLNTGRRVAVKVLHGEWMQRPEVAQRFVREARATTAIAHPNIVEVLDLDTDASRSAIYIVQEYLEGETLESYLTARRDPRLAAPEALQILVPVMGALVAAHVRGVVHRDIKPANIFLARSRGGERVPKLIDFGIAKDVATASGITNRTQEGSTLGTPAYMSPEQVSGRADLDAQTDVWSLGVVLYEMLSGCRPFEAPHQNVLMAKILYESPLSLAAHRPDLSSDLLSLVESALQRDRRHRFTTVRAMMAVALECDAWPHDATPSSAFALGGDQRTSSPPPMSVAVHLATMPCDSATSAEHSTHPMLTPPSNHWNLIAPHAPLLPHPPVAHPGERSPDSMHAVARTVLEPTPHRTRWPFALSGVLLLAILVGTLVASFATRSTSVVAPIVMSSAAVAPAPSHRALFTSRPPIGSVPVAPAARVLVPQAVVRPQPERPAAAMTPTLQPLPRELATPTLRPLPRELAAPTLQPLPRELATPTEPQRRSPASRARPIRNEPPRGASPPADGVPARSSSPRAPTLNADEI